MQINMPHAPAFLPPLVLVIGGHDPSGAGIQADNETLFALGCHAATTVTALTVQTTRGVRRVAPVAADLLREQVSALREDFRPFAACKVGLVPSAELVDAVADLVAAMPGVPVVVDPVLGAGGGGALGTDGARARLSERLLPLATVVTPNMNEARRLVGDSDVAVLGRALSAGTRRYALLTGADEATREVAHRLYRDGALFAEYRWPRLPHRYHGSGCTLASAIAAFLAHGATPAVACARAQAYTWSALTRAHEVGGDQLIPGRLMKDYCVRSPGFSTAC